MPKLERLKEELSIHKQIFFAAWAVVVGLVGWSASHYGKVSNWLMLGALAGVVASALIGEFQRRRMNQLLKEIEDA